MSAAEIPQIACVMGSCTAGGAYVPAMSDETVIVRNQGTIFLAGPPLVKAATGEVISAEELGGADTHGRRSGVVDHVAANDEHALQIVRRIVSHLNTTKPQPLDVREPRPPAYDPGSCTGSSPGRPRPLRRARGDRPHRRRLGVRRVQGALRDHPGLRLRPHLGHAGGHPGQQRRALLGVRAEGRALRGALLQAPHPAPVPAEHLGLHGGGKYEAGGIAKDGAKLVTAVACAEVPKITV
jgi:3-methylcrotonyl-CoA carboxylase beta subunit